MGRPTSYNKELVDKSWDYINGEWMNHSNTVPSVVGLCKYINRSKSIIYDWAKDEDKEFSDILSALMESQEEILTEKGLLKTFDTTLTKLFLTKHGYSDKSEVSQKTEHSFSSMTDEELEKIARGG